MIIKLNIYMYIYTYTHGCYANLGRVCAKQCTMIWSPPCALPVPSGTKLICGCGRLKSWRGHRRSVPLRFLCLWQPHTNTDHSSTAISNLPLQIPFILSHQNQCTLNAHLLRSYKMHANARTKGS